MAKRNTRSTSRFVDIEKNGCFKKAEFEQQHCKVCGDTQPKHGFFPLWGIGIGDGIVQTSGLTCNRCARSDAEYHEVFGEPKEIL